MPAIRCFPAPNVSLPLAGETHFLFGDDYGLASDTSQDVIDREDAVWEDLPIPVSVTVPLDGPMACEAVLPAHYEPAYAYPLIVWLSPSPDIDFRERIIAISERNFLALALYWSGFDDMPAGTVAPTAGCRQLVDAALSFVESVWNIHPGRRHVLAEGATACAWGMRLIEHAPQQFASLVCIQPGGLSSPVNGIRRSTAGTSKRVLVFADSDESAGDRSCESVDSWWRHATRLSWSIEFRHSADRKASRPRAINAWLMSQMASR